MDINDLRGIATVLCMLAFAAVVWWAYGSSRRSRFEEDARMPFIDEEAEKSTDLKQSTEKQSSKEGDKQ